MKVSIEGNKEILQEYLPWTPGTSGFEIMLTETGLKNLSEV